MVDGVSFNPFTGKVFTPEEIEKLDKNNDKKISSDELQAGLAWLTGGPDEEGEVDFGPSNTTPPTPPTPTATGNKVYDKSVLGGVKDTAETAAKLKEYMAKIQDNYIEQYMQDNPGLTSAEKSSLVVFIKNTSAEFIKEYTDKNPKSPYDTKSVATELMAKLDTAVAARKEAIVSIGKEVSDIKSNTEDKYEKLSSYADKADDDYVTADEYAQMKKDAIEYIMSLLMNEGENVDLIKGIDANYKTNTNYKVAVKALKDLETATDPAKIRDLLEQAKVALDKFIGPQNADGTSRLNKSINAIADKKVTAEEQAKIDGYKKTISSINDKMVETMSNDKVRNGFMLVNRPQEEIDDYAKMLTKIMDAFIAQYKGDGKNLETEYAAFLQKTMTENQDAMNAVEGLPKGDALIDSLSKSVAASGPYISDAESKDIKTQMGDLVLSEMFNGSTEIKVLIDAYPNYAKDPLFVEAKKLVDGFASSITRKEDLAKIKELIGQLMDKVGAKAIAEGVKIENQKTVGLSKDSSMTAYLHGYNANNTVGGDDLVYTSFNVKDGKVQWTHGTDAPDIQKTMQQLTERIHSKMKAQLGDKYVAADIEKYIDQAVIEAMMSISDPGALHKTSELVDLVLQKFDKIATDALHKNSPAANPGLDRSDVLSGADAYDDYSEGVRTGGFDRKGANARTSVRNDAKAKLEILRASVRSQIQAKLGSNYDSAAIDQLVSDALSKTVENFPFYDTRAGHTGYKYGYDVSQLYNTFFDNFDSAYGKYVEKMGFNK